MSMRNLDLLVPRDPADPNLTVWATVTAISPVRIKLDGETNPLPFTPDSLVANLNVNDRVLVMLLTNTNPATRSRRVVILGESGPVDPLLSRVVALEATDAAMDAGVGRGMRMAVSAGGGNLTSSAGAGTAAASESSLFTAWTTGTNSMTWQDQRLYRVDGSIQVSNNLAGLSSAYNFSRFSSLIRSSHTGTGNLTALGGITKNSMQNQHLDEDFIFWFLVKVTGGNVTSGVGISITKDFSSEACTMILDAATVIVTDIGSVALPGAAVAAVMA